MTERSQSQDIRLGLFLFSGIIVLFLGVFFVGRENKIFDTRVLIKAHFENVAGLSVGANVMLSGVVVGHVSAIKFPLNKSSLKGISRDVTVEMEISQDALKWVREDSLASIDSKGLLGDKIINISIGSFEIPQMQKGGMLKSSQPVDFNRALEKAQGILTNVSETVIDARDVFKNFVEKGGEDSLLSSVQAMQDILTQVKNGEGLVSALLFDSAVSSEGKKAITNFKELVRNLGVVIDGVKTEKGVLGHLIFNEKGKETINKLNDNLDEIKLALGEVKSGNGVLHELIYGKQESNFLADINHAAGELKKLTDSLSKGDGTLGLLIKDPSIYNEIYGILGDLQRNSLVKALVRYGISSADSQQQVQP